MDTELQDVKRELSKLQGCTIRTVPQGKPNIIVEITDKGFMVQATAKASLVSWEAVLDKYRELRSQGTLVRSEKHDRGAFIMPLLAKLTTVDITSRPQRTCYYMRKGRPVTLRDLAIY